MRVLQRVIMPLDRDPDVLKLYVDGAAGPGNPAVAVGRHGLALLPGARVSLCTYFNAFPASYWRRWTTIDDVRLRVRARGAASVLVYRSNSKGQARQVAAIEIDTELAAGGAQAHVVSLPLRPFTDGGWYWFDIVSGARDAILESAEWDADTTGVPRGTTSIGITTYNRPGFCVQQLTALGAAPDVLEIVDEIFVIDQGTDRVEDHPGFEKAAKTLAGRLHVIGQGNLGGSGGFARAMDETVRSGNSDYLLLLDDDIVSEPEGILRAAAFADHARRPTVVGGHMFSLHERSVMHAFAETVAPRRWWWGPAPHSVHGHDFAAHSLRNTAWLHRRIDADYNGWWMCLIPTAIIQDIGLPLPMFIKWDDAEYGMRATGAGYPVMSQPGVAVWHVPWQDKDDAIDWQAYFHERNRLVSALLHQPCPRGGHLIKDSLATALKHLLSMRYSTAALQMMAIEDVLTGPGHLHAGIATKIAEIRAFRKDFPDAQARDRVDEFPPPRRAGPPRHPRTPEPPKSRLGMLRRVGAATLRHLRPARPSSLRAPEAVISHVDQHWWWLSRFDSALVSSAEGTTTFWYRRDAKRFRALLLRGVVLHARLLLTWPRLRRDYRERLPELTSARRWRETFKASGPGRA